MFFPVTLFQYLSASIPSLLIEKIENLHRGRKFLVVVYNEDFEGKDSKEVILHKNTDSVIFITLANSCRSSFLSPANV